MRNRRVARISGTALMLAALFGPPAAHAAEDERRAEIRALMQAARSSLQTLLASSVKGDAPHKPAYARSAVEAIEAMSDVSAALETHMQSADARYLAELLSYQAWWIGFAFDLEQMAAVEALALATTNICVACHTRLPDAIDPPTAEAFVPDASLGMLEPLSRARLEIATRRFEPALARLKSRALAPGLDWSEAGRAAVLYLDVSIRVKRDLEGPRRLVAELATRTPQSDAASTATAEWIESLQHVSLDVPPTELLSTARGLVDMTGAQSRGSAGRRTSPPAERTQLIEHLVAASLLQQLLENSSLAVPESAEAEYLLGKCYARVHEDSRTPLATFHLERAVRLSPDAPWARAAARDLEALMFDLFETNERDSLPRDAAEQLEALDALVRP